MNDWQIEHQCPQCGAPVLLDETDRLLDCKFCRTRLLLTAPEGFRYILPPPAGVTGRELLFLPYWRLKGTSYDCRSSGIVSRFVDTSTLALDAAGLPRTLGVRPQAMTLKFRAAGQAGRFLEPGVPCREVVRAAAAQAAGGDGPQEFIGETVSLIHTPVYFDKNALYDAILKRPLPLSADRTGALAALLDTPAPPTVPVGFLPAQCPRCGWDLEGERDSLVLTCQNCQSAWAGRDSGWDEVVFRVLTTAAAPVFYLPFWRMQARLDGLEMRSFADLIRFANLPRVVTPAFSAAPVHFWSPAFKINPAQFLRWARQLTAAQPDGEGNAKFPEASRHPVTLPLSEAGESIRITLADLAPNKRQALPLLKEIRVTVEEARLVYHPFLVGRSELLHERLHLTLDRTALAYGSQL
ncbi:MAG TPA: hypothetical protein PKH03_03455 [Syntrophales bacterium]|nr:hypothetical protein [Syntrophales bacterium]